MSVRECRHLIPGEGTKATWLAYACVREYGQFASDSVKLLLQSLGFLLSPATIRTACGPSVFVHVPAGQKGYMTWHIYVKMSQTVFEKRNGSPSMLDWKINMIMPFWCYENNDTEI